MEETGFSLRTRYFIFIIMLVVIVRAALGCMKAMNIGEQTRSIVGFCLCIGLVLANWSYLGF
jgi:hypothetical protein